MERPFMVTALIIYFLALLAIIGPGVGVSPVALAIIAGILVVFGILTGK